MDRETMIRAFALVNPRRFANEMAARGLVSQEAADRIDWKGPIAAVVAQCDLEEHSLTIEQVAAAVLLMTGTTAIVRPLTLHGTNWVSYLPRTGVPGYLVQADGHSAGLKKSAKVIDDHPKRR